MYDLLPALFAFAMGGLLLMTGINQYKQFLSQKLSIALEILTIIVLFVWNANMLLWRRSDYTGLLLIKVFYCILLIFILAFSTITILARHKVINIKKKDQKLLKIIGIILAILYFLAVIYIIINT